MQSQSFTAGHCCRSFEFVVQNDYGLVRFDIIGTRSTATRPSYGMDVIAVLEPVNRFTNPSSVEGRSREHTTGSNSAVHYENMPMQHTAIFHGCKNDKFQLKIFDYFLIFAQNIDCGYTLEPPH